MDIIKPGNFANNIVEHNFIVCADSKRQMFDRSNETLLRRGKKPDFVFLGDSLTDGYDINSYFGDTSFCVNRGIGGDVPMFIFRRLDADVLQLKPKYCVMLAGVNEIWTLDSHFDSEKDFSDCYDRTKHYITDYTEKIICRCEEKGQKLIVCSILPTLGRVSHFGKDANDLIIECNRHTAEFCEKHGALFINYHPLFCAEDGKTLREELTVDGVHLTPAGYDLMSDTLIQSLREKNIKI